MFRLIARLLLVGLLFTAFGTPLASADYRDLILDACRQDQRVDGTYSQKDYREALDNLSDDQLQYTDCEAIIRSAQLAAARAESGDGSGTSGLSGILASGGGDPLATATPAERAAFAQAVEQAEDIGGDDVSVDGKVVTPSALGAGRAVSASVSDLPFPLLVALLVSALAGLVALGSSTVTRVRARRHS